MKHSSLDPKIPEISHDDIMAMVERGRAERSEHIARGLRLAVAAVGDWWAHLTAPSASFRPRHH